MPRPRLLLPVAAIAALAAYFAWPEPAAPLEVAATEPEPAAPLKAAAASAATTEPESAPRVATGTLIAHRRYEQLLHGRRATIIDVVWTEDEYEGRPAVRDVTTFRSRTVRDMAGVRDLFESETVMTTIRTHDGDLLSLEAVVEAPGRTDREEVRRTATGYAVHRMVGGNPERYEFETDGPAKVDAESYLGPKIRAGEAKPGTKWTYPSLDSRGKKLVPSELAVVGEEERGLKVVETIEGQVSIWWFDAEGGVAAHRAGDTMIRRADAIALDDLPSAPATYPVTLPMDRYLPRMFTTKSMVVDIVVRTDETVRPPKIPENPFTEVIEESDDRVRVRCLSHDDPEATVTLPIPREGFEEHLRATPLMDVDSPQVRRWANRLARDETDARRVATRIADFVFRALRKDSPAVAELTATEILESRVGDCSEHALLFTALCRAAGIPARRCHGWVCIGEGWGGHAWSEIWLGKWIGADPTTNEIGTRARYIFTGRQDDREMRGAVLLAARTRLFIRSAEYSDGTIDFETEEEPDLVVLSGLRLGPLPEGWTAQHHRSGMLLLRGPSFFGRAMIRPDQGYREKDTLGLQRAEDRTLGGRRAYRVGSLWVVPLGRENLQLNLSADVDPDVLAEVFGPTLQRAE